MESGMQGSVPAALLLLGIGIATFAAYVALDFARRVRVLRTRSGVLWLLGAAAALAVGIWSAQILGIAAETLPFPLGYDGAGTLLMWLAAAVAGAPKQFEFRDSLYRVTAAGALH